MCWPKIVKSLYIWDLWSQQIRCCMSVFCHYGVNNDGNWITLESILAQLSSNVRSNKLFLYKWWEWFETSDQSWLWFVNITIDASKVETDRNTKKGTSELYEWLFPVLGQQEVEFCLLIFIFLASNELFFFSFYCGIMYSQCNFKSTEELQ